MSDTKIFSLGDQSAGGSMPAILASLCQNRGLDPNMVAAMMNNRGNGWGDSAWWIIILLIFGWGGFGGGYGFNGRGNGQGLADLGKAIRKFTKSRTASPCITDSEYHRLGLVR